MTDQAESEHAPQPPGNQARSSVRSRALEEALLADVHNPHRVFVVARDTFDESLSALRQVHGAVTPSLQRLDEARFGDAIASATADLEPGKANQIVLGVLVLMRSGRRMGARRLGSEAASGAEAAASEATSGVRLTDEATGDMRDDLTETELDELGNWLSHELKDTPETLVHLFRLFEREFVTPERQTLIRGLLLTAAAAAFEALLAALLVAFYEARPERLGDEPRFSLSDLQEFGSLDDAREEAIGRRVDGILHGDLAEWGKWLDQNTGLQLPNLTIDFARLFEIFQRRHVILHAGGRVSRLYKRRMEEFGQKAPEVGASLRVDREYLEDAFDELQAVGALTTVGIWSKAYPAEEKFALHGLYLQSYDLMLEERWRAVRKICALGKLSKESDEVGRHVFQVNEWLAVKRLNGLGEVREAIENWDTSALLPRFRFMQRVLLDALSGAFAMAPTLMHANQLDENDLLEWPALREMRADERFRGLIASRSNVPSAPATDGDGAPPHEDDDGEQAGDGDGGAAQQPGSPPSVRPA